jgi:hypothetical protein
MRKRKNLAHQTSFIICALMFASFSSARATINSTYIGPIGGNWSDPANWSPAIVPDNNASQKFNVFVASEFPGVTLDLDVRLRSLTLTEEFSSVFLLDRQNDS